MARVPVDHPDFGRLAPCQCQMTELLEERQARLFRFSNLGPLTRLTFDSLEPQGLRADPAAQKSFYDCYTMAKIFADSPKRWLVFTGPSGCGKTHLAAAIANHRLSLGQPVFFMVVPDLLDHLRATFSPSSDLSYDDLFQLVCTIPLLILDDLGTQSSTPWAREKLFQIVNQRYNAQLPTVFTTNALEELEERLRTRLMDSRLSTVCQVMEGQSFLVSLKDPMETELLKSMTFDSFQRGIHFSEDERHSLNTAYNNAKAFAESPEGWLVLLGPTGRGKTHLAAAIANYRKGQGDHPVFQIVPDLLDHFRSAFNPDNRIVYDRLFDQVRTTPLLILDDLGTQSSTPWAQEKLFQIINYRYNARLPTVFTSRYSLDEIEDPLSSRMGDLRLSIVVVITAPDYRVDRKPVERSPRLGRGGRRGH